MSDQNYVITLKGDGPWYNATRFSGARLLAQCVHFHKTPEAAKKCVDRIVRQMTRDEHIATYTRRQLGRSVLFNRPLYGWTVTCACGWSIKVNDGKREAQAHFSEHRRATIG